MNQGYYDKKALSTNKTAYYFDGLMDYLKFTKDVEPKMTGNARRGWDRLKGEANVRSNASNSWFGTTDVQKIIGDKKSFLFNDVLDRFLQSIVKRAVNTDIIDIDQKKKLEFTEKDIGIFSFDLAALGLVRVNEYYSPLLNVIVDSDYVRSYMAGDGQLVFYHIKVEAIPRHIVRYSGKEGGYFSNVLKKLIPASDLQQEVVDNEIVYYFPETFEIPQHDVEKRQKRNEDGGLKFATTWKKSFIHIPRPISSLPRIDLIIASSYMGGVDATNSMVWNTMAGLAVAQKLSQSNINYRIIAAYTDGLRGGKEVYTFVKIKDEAQPLNPNMMATLISDARFFRYETFLGSFATMFDAGYDANIDYMGISSAINDTESDPKIRNAYIDYLKTNKGYSDRMAAKNFDSKIVFRQALSENQAVAEYNRVIDKISKL
jgi:hypothetical protein